MDQTENPIGRFSPEALSQGVSLSSEFVQQLASRAAEHMKSRGSKVLTDTDMQAAYRDLTIRPANQKMHRAAGDSAMVVGGAALSASVSMESWIASLFVIILGIVVVTLGVYIREFARHP